MTLAELLVGLTVLGTLLAATFGVLDVGLRAWAFGTARVEAQQGSRIALERLAAEIRQAGAGIAGPAISVAEPTRLVLHLDRDGDGRAAGPSETIAWLLRGAVLRRSAGAGAQPVVPGVRALHLAYLDARGAPTTEPGEVRTVLITLTTGPDRRPGPAVTFSTAAHLRNR